MDFWTLWVMPAASNFWMWRYTSSISAGAMHLERSLKGRGSDRRMVFSTPLASPTSSLVVERRHLLVQTTSDGVLFSTLLEQGTRQSWSSWHKIWLWLLFWHCCHISNTQVAQNSTDCYSCNFQQLTLDLYSELINICCIAGYHHGLPQHICRKRVRRRGFYYHDFIRQRLFQQNFARCLKLPPAGGLRRPGPSYFTHLYAIF